ncbi:MAG: hypothetical protein AB8F78_12985 [Saprospiraceae bacterium]
MIGILAMVAADNTVFPSEIYAVRIFAWGAIAGISYAVIALAFAQIRAKAQPMDHTLRMSPEGVEVVNNLKQSTREFEWSDFERVAISDEGFEIKRKEAKRGETYFVKRAALSPEEDTFLGTRLVDLG